MPVVLRAAVGGLATWLVGFGFFAATGKLGVFGLGYGDLSDSLTGRFGPWEIAGLLVAAKVFVSAASYAWGGCGGIFSPTLFMGGFTGLFLSGAASLLLPLGSGDRLLLCACGMSACFGAAVRAPFTAVLIVFEMTHQFSIVPALMLATLVSQAVAARFGRVNLYDALLGQDGHELAHPAATRARASWAEIPVSSICSRRTVALERLDRNSARELLDWHPFKRFPVLEGGSVIGIARRAGLEAFASGGDPPEMLEAVFCSPGESVQEAARLLVESPSGMVVLGDACGAPQGVVTLHDLIRAQVAIDD